MSKIGLIYKDADGRHLVATYKNMDYHIIYNNGETSKMVGVFWFDKCELVTDKYAGRWQEAVKSKEFNESDLKTSFEHINNWTPAEITSFSIAAFPLATLETQTERFEIESKEFKEAYGQNEMLSELADMFIVACGIGRFNAREFIIKMSIINTTCQAYEVSSTVFTEAIQKKMRINIQRYKQGYWAFNQETGQYEGKSNEKEH